MSGFTGPALQQALESSAPGVAVGHRLIAPGDEAALLDEEARSIVSKVVAVRRASGAARLVARDLLGRLGHPACPVPKVASGAPAWPPDVVGSLAHDGRIAVAAIALRREVEMLGIDVEPAEPLPLDVLDLIATERERLRHSGAPFQGRLLFAAKEAVYKAVYPVDQVFLDYHDIEVDLADRKAIVLNRRVLELRFLDATHLVVLAFARISGKHRHPGSDDG
jgi:4'-phosphopantetheinyl transferase EntD